jgi:hypothetical protein
MASNFQHIKKTFILQEDLAVIPLHLRPDFDLDAIDSPVRMSIYGVILPNASCDDDEAKKELASTLIEELGSELKHSYFVWVGNVRSPLGAKKSLMQFNSWLRLSDSIQDFDQGRLHAVCEGNLLKHCADLKGSLTSSMYKREIYIVTDEHNKTEYIFPHILDTKFDTCEINMLSYLSLNPKARIGNFFGSPDFGGIYFRQFSCEGVPGQ